MKEQTEERVYLDDNAHDFHIHIANECGVGYNELRTFLENLDDEQILESIDSYVELKLKENMENTKLEREVNTQAVRLYAEVLRGKLLNFSGNGESVEEVIADAEKAVNALKSYFKVG